MKPAVPEQARMPPERHDIRSKSEFCFPVWPSISPKAEPPRADIKGKAPQRAPRK